jgi:hypothetical protein
MRVVIQLRDQGTQLPEQLLPRGWRHGLEHGFGVRGRVR